MANAKWNESDCVRDSEGQFAHKPGSDAKPVTGSAGIPYEDAKPVETIDNKVSGWSHAYEDDMAEFRAGMTVEPIVMGNRDYGEAAAIRPTNDGYAVDLYSGLHPATPLESSDGYETREKAEQAARDMIASEDSVLRRFEKKSLDRFAETYGVEPYDEDTVVIHEDDGQIEVRFDADTAIVTAYSGNGNHVWTDGAELHDGESIDDYLKRVADATATL